jgi:hypothetical protein
MQYLASTGGSEQVLRLWQVPEGRNALTIPVHHQVLAVTWQDGRLVIGLSSGLIAVAVSDQLGS